MNVTFLGTGTSHGVPMIGCRCATCSSADPRDRRTRPSIFIETDDGTSILVDAGPDLRAQALAYGVNRVDAIIFTHGHADHILGLDDVRRYNAIMRQPMALYGDAQTLADIRRLFGYVFDPDSPKGGGLPQLELFTIIGPFCLHATHGGGFGPCRQKVVPVPILHGTRPILGLRFSRFAYLTDCSSIPDASLALLEDLDVVVLDALRDRPHPTHFSLDQAVEAARRIGARRTLFTHMCHDLPHAATCARLPEGMSLAYDGLRLQCT